MLRRICADSSTPMAVSRFGNQPGLGARRVCRSAQLRQHRARLDAFLQGAGFQLRRRHKVSAPQMGFDKTLGAIWFRNTSWSFPSMGTTLASSERRDHAVKQRPAEETLMRTHHRRHPPALPTACLTTWPAVPRAPSRLRYYSTTRDRRLRRPGKETGRHSDTLVVLTDESRHRCRDQVRLCLGSVSTWYWRPNIWRCC